MTAIYSMRKIRGATMIEALVAILILSFGMLALGSFLAYGGPAAQALGQPLGGHGGRHRPGRTHAGQLVRHAR